MKHTIDGLFWFTDLSEDAKNIARTQVTSAETAGFKLNLHKYKCRPLHSKINDLIGIRSLLRHSAYFKIKSQGETFLDKIIICNFCEFDKDGQYYTFENGIYGIHNN